MPASTLLPATLGNVAILFIGLMSGTSMDAIDAALTDFSEPTPVLVNAIDSPLDGGLREECLALASGCAYNAKEHWA